MEAKKTLRVLIVDDNREFADSLATLIRLRGYDVFVAYRTLDGLRMASDDVPELIIHDLEMPDLDGYEAARRLRSDPRFQKTIMVAITGNDAPAIIRSTHLAGYDRFLAKPLDYAAMVDTLHATDAAYA